jgi:hypothetical protein
MEVRVYKQRIRFVFTRLLVGICAVIHAAAGVEIAADRAAADPHVE